MQNRFICSHKCGLVLLYFFCGLSLLLITSANSVFTNSFLVKFQQNIKNDIAHEIATRNGFENVGEVNIFKSDHLFYDKS